LQENESEEDATDWIFLSFFTEDEKCCIARPGPEFPLRYWKALLDNAAPSLGTLDIGEALRAQIPDLFRPQMEDGG
jgi:hypothetical protein